MQPELFRDFRQGFGVYPTSYPVNVVPLFLGVKQPELETDCLLSITQAKSGGSIPSFLHTSS
jgi:hypothetical protein